MDAALLELKPESGALAYASKTDIPADYGLNGTTDLAALVAEMKKKDIYLAARISCFADSLLSQRNTPLAVKDESGQPYADSEGRYWLDPYNLEVRSYITALMDELADMGFDEIVLSNVSSPQGENLVYTQETIAQLDVTHAISSFSVRVTGHMAQREFPIPDSFPQGSPEVTGGDDDEDTPDAEASSEPGDGGVDDEDAGEAEEDGEITPPERVLVSAVLSPQVLRGGPASPSGEDLEVFFTFYDRVYVDTSAQELESDLRLAESYIKTGDVLSRFVPVMSASGSGGSWVIK